MAATTAFAQPKLTSDNIDEVLKAMTLEEKATLVVGYNEYMSSFFTGGDNGMLGQNADRVPGAAGQTQAVERLGIPITVLTDGPAGVRIAPTRNGTDQTFYATGFPIGTLLACTWDQELIEAVGRSMGNEVLEYGCDVLLAPGMNIHRSPLCGRNFEYFSEDPLVAGKVAAAYTRGIQSNGVGVSLKHYAVNSQETNRMECDEVVDQRALREIYLKNFEIAVRESDPWTIMSSYNKLNGEYTQQSRDLLTTILRDEWGFSGIVMTDWTGARNIAAQLHAGNDLMEPGMPSQSQDVINAVKNGTLDVADLDICVRRLLEYVVKTPSFKGYKYSDKPDLKAHAAVTRQSATEGMVLLKNEAGTLPLQGTPTVALFGVTSYDFIAGGTGSGNVNKAYTVDLVEGLTQAGLKVTDDLSSYYKKYIAYAKAEYDISRAASFWDQLGSVQAPELNIARYTIDQQALKADVAIVTIGRQAGEGGDRTIDGDFTLSTLERTLLNNVNEAFHAQGKKVIVIMNIGGPIETASWKGLADAILLAWAPGQEAGNSVADLLTGKANPSGKLTMTFPVSIMDIPSSRNYPNVLHEVASSEFSFGGGKPEKKNVDYTLHAEGINVGYRFFDTQGVEVSYPFGYGLSYTTFAYSKPTVKATRTGFQATITVTNTGSVAGKEAVQLYVAAPAGGLAKPAKELRSFAKTRLLQPGESQVLTFDVTNYGLASFNIDTQCWESPAGKYQVLFGANVEDIRATGIYTLSKAFSLQAHDVLRPNRDL